MPRERVTLPDNLETLWEDCLAAERVRVRQDFLIPLKTFLEAFGRLPRQTRHAWGQQLAREIADEQKNITVRTPLFQEVILPALVAGLRDGVPGSARHLYRIGGVLPSNFEVLPEEARTGRGLLERAIRDDPDDLYCKEQLLQQWRHQFDYALHELPDAVLYTNDHGGAMLKECDKLLQDLEDYERMASSLGWPEQDWELINEARFYVPAYRRFRIEPGMYAKFGEFLGATYPEGQWNVARTD